jgi:hypothetical protein
MSFRPTVYKVLTAEVGQSTRGAWVSVLIPMCGLEVVLRRDGVLDGVLD